VAEKRDRRGLGRGLSSLLGEPGQAPDAEPSTAAETLPAVPETGMRLDVIRPNSAQPRTHLDPAALATLAESIRENGLLQPLVVRPVEDGYELIAGERRWRAAQEAGLTTVPVVIRDAEAADRLRLALIENVVREDLNALEVANACATLVEDFGVTHEDVGRTVGRSRSAVSNLIRLLELPDDVQDLVISGDLTEGHARAILIVDGTAQRRRLAKAVIENGLSVRATEALAREGVPSPSTRRTAELGRSELGDLALEAFGDVFDVPVRVKHAARGRVVVELRFDDEAALTAALDRLG